MLVDEFSELTGIYPSTYAYKIIEKYYMDSELDKQTFCKNYMEDVNGIAQKISYEVSCFICDSLEEKEQKLEETLRELEIVKEKLKKEEEWGLPYVESSCDYHPSYRSWDESELLWFLSSVYGFQRERIHIVREIPEWRKNRHGLIKKQKTGRDCSPYYEATDLNFARFSVGELTYEYKDGAVVSCEYMDNELLSE